MDTPNISDTEFKRCLIVWEKEPVSSSRLATICACSFGWARTTTHTFIRRLVDRGVLRNDKGTVTSLVSKETAQNAALLEIICRRLAFVDLFAKSRENAAVNKGKTKNKKPCSR